MGKKKKTRVSDNIAEEKEYVGQSSKEEEYVSQSSTNEKSLYEVCENVSDPHFHGATVSSLIAKGVDPSEYE
ncbi:hypothetical protein CK203_074475 [Vitis vinifera]|uniref:Uncharacterized protein n=1 Tax=Vitis vinifera TaxID=29760 RepID=A0A438EGY9_VITVI|nr:hypothetical protein CK203_074475 [Vitis vinifera]